MKIIKTISTLFSGPNTFKQFFIGLHTKDDTPTGFVELIDDTGTELIDDLGNELITTD